MVIAWAPMGIRLNRLLACSSDCQTTQIDLALSLQN